MAGLSPVLVYKLSDNVLTHITVTDKGWFAQDEAGNPVKLEGDRLQAAAMYVANNKISPERIIPAGHHLMPDGTVMADEAHTPPRGVSEQLAAKVGPSDDPHRYSRSGQSRPEKGSLDYYTAADQKRKQLIAARDEAGRRLIDAKTMYDASQPGGLDTMGHPTSTMPTSTLPDRSTPTLVQGQTSGEQKRNEALSRRTQWAAEARNSPLLREEWNSFDSAQAELDKFDAAHPDVLQMINPEGGYPAEFEGRLSDADAHYRRAQWEQSKAEQ